MRTILSSKIPWSRWQMLLDWLRENRFFTLSKPIRVLGVEVSTVEIVFLRRAKFNGYRYEVTIEIWECIFHDDGQIMLPPEQAIALREILKEDPLPVVTVETLRQQQVDAPSI